MRCLEAVIALPWRTQYSLNIVQLEGSSQVPLILCVFLGRGLRELLLLHAAQPWGPLAPLSSSIERKLRPQLQSQSRLLPWGNWEAWISASTCPLHWVTLI
jgi:hypothetical protein